MLRNHRSCVHRTEVCIPIIRRALNSLQSPRSNVEGCAATTGGVVAAEVLGAGLPLGSQLTSAFTWEGPIQPSLLSSAIPESGQGCHAIAQPTAKLLHVTVTIHTTRLAEATVAPTVIAIQRWASTGVCAWLIDTPFHSVLTPILPHHHHHVPQSATGCFWEGYSHIEFSICINNASTRAILVRTHVTRALSVLHVRLLHASEAAGQARMVICVVQGCVPPKLVPLHEIDLATSAPESSARVTLPAIAPLHKIYACDATATSVPNINLHTQCFA